MSKTLKTERNRASAVVDKLREEQLKILYSLKSFFMACDLDGNGTRCQQFSDRRVDSIVKFRNTVTQSLNPEDATQ